MRRYYTVILSTLILTIGLVLLAPAALAQPVCGPHQSISDSLKKSYTEAPVSMGLTVSGGIIEVFASKEGTWTMVITQPNGTSCLIAVGQDWENLPNPEILTGARI
ncbi:MAG TPA: hypothetical protein QGH84_03500 [Rhodospirillales bacterium]|jgi:hypothetical protein|nr:hypothetical protein [Rhodospirillales bacterium]|tara:strand:+ start:197 stop:514 length:318 start_codon:yes stop_codon:yes gene_type:complete